MYLYLFIYIFFYLFLFIYIYFKMHVFFFIIIHIGFRILHPPLFVCFSSIFKHFQTPVHIFFWSDKCSTFSLFVYYIYIHKEITITFNLLYPKHLSFSFNSLFLLFFLPFLSLPCFLPLFITPFPLLSSCFLYSPLQED